MPGGTQSGRGFPEWVAANYRNGWLRLGGMGGRDFPEQVASLLRNMQNNASVDYAPRT